MADRFGLGALPDPPDERDYLAALYLPTVPTLPDVVDIPLPPVASQGKVGECVGWAHAYQHSPTEDLHTSGRLSPQSVYHEAKLRDGYSGEGTYPRAAYQGQQQAGTCEESLWPYEARYPPSNSPAPGYSENAATHKIQVYAAVERTVDAICTALAAQKPVAFSMSVYNNFFSVGNNGLVPDPAGTIVGGHRMVLPGYGRVRKLFTCQNSWGTNWGAGGLCYFRFDQIAMFQDLNVVTDMPDITKPWSDWPDTNIAEAIAVNNAGAFHGFPDGTFHPWENVSRHQVELVFARLEGLPEPPVPDAAVEATRGWVRDTIPGLTWLESRWSEPLSRFQLALLIARKLQP